MHLRLGRVYLLGQQVVLQEQGEEEQETATAMAINCGISHLMIFPHSEAKPKAKHMGHPILTIRIHRLLGLTGFSIRQIIQTRHSIDKTC
jgi:hypothetical protein